MINLEWSQKEINLLENSYVVQGENYLSEILDRSPNAIRIMASRLKIKKFDYRNDIVLSYIEEQVLLGGLLGDMYCRIPKTCKNARIEGAHCKKQESYLLWKISLLNNLHFKLRRNNLGYLFFRSKNYSCLNYYFDLFYKNKKKEITCDILNKVNDFGLAIWYMDDGSYSKRDHNCSLYTNGFTYEENLIIKKYFETKWNIFPKIYIHKEIKRYPNKKWYFLNFNVAETKKLIKIIKPYIHSSMKYKIGVYNYLKKEGKPRR